MAKSGKKRAVFSSRQCSELSICACGKNNLADHIDTAEDHNLRTTAPR